MSFLDDAKNLAEKAEELAKQHPDQVKAALDKAEQFADEQTGGKYSDQIKAAGDKAEGFLSNN